MAQPVEEWISPEEYLRREALSPTKNEYFDGQIDAMTRASKEHSRIAVNLLRILANALRGTPCEAFESNVRVRVKETGLYTYPDLSVACEGEFDGETLLNPIILIEILSPSTEDYDEWHREGTMTIEEPSLAVPLDEVYERVRLSPQPPLR